MLAKNLPADHPSATLGVGVIIKLFSEHGHVAYPIKGNDACSNMVSNIFTRRPQPRNPRGGVKIQLLQNMVLLQIKLSEITNAATC